jgi:GrpB-like predicted nucleotidyltransferase (UPF0157 family)
MPDRDPADLAWYEEHLSEVTVGGAQPLSSPIELHEYDPAWPLVYADEERQIRAALGEDALRVEHAGSTSVPGLTAKPILDIVLEVADSADEAAYVPPLEAAGYAVRIREPEWLEHRMLKRLVPEVNLHVFSAECDEVERMLAFRDHLRGNAADRELYARVKRELAGREWRYTQQYADAKSAVVREILSRAS